MTVRCRRRSLHDTRRCTHRSNRSDARADQPDRHTLRLSDALFRAGRPFEALALPGVTHMVSADPVVMERLWARNAAFFRQHLGAPR